MTDTPPSGQEPDLMGGPEPDEEHTDVLGGTQPGGDVMPDPDNLRCRHDGARRCAAAPDARSMKYRYPTYLLPRAPLANDGT
jgi:hypothetical protein